MKLAYSFKFSSCQIWTICAQMKSFLTLRLCVYISGSQKLGYSCRLRHFDQIFVTLGLYFYLTHLTQKCKDNETQAVKSQNHCIYIVQNVHCICTLLFVHVIILTFVYQTIRVLRVLLWLKTFPGNTTKFINSSTIIKISTKGVQQLGWQIVLIIRVIYTYEYMPSHITCTA